MRVVGSQDALAVGQGPLEQEDGLLKSVRSLVGGGEAATCGQGVGVVRSQSFIEKVHGVGQGQGGLRVPELRRVPQGVRKGTRGAGAGEQAPGMVLPGRRPQLLHKIEDLATTAATVPNRDGGDVHRPQEPGGRLLDPPPTRRLGLPRLPNHSALKFADHHFGAIL